MEQLIEMIQALLEDARVYQSETDESGTLEDRQAALDYVSDLDELLANAMKIVQPFDYEDGEDIAGEVYDHDDGGV